MKVSVFGLGYVGSVVGNNAPEFAEALTVDSGRLAAQYDGICW